MYTRCMLALTGMRIRLGMMGLSWNLAEGTPRHPPSELQKVVLQNNRLEVFVVRHKPAASMVWLLHVSTLKILWAKVRSSVERLTS